MSKTDEQGDTDGLIDVSNKGRFTYMNMYKVALDVCECVDRQHGHLKFNPCRRLWADSDRYIHVYIYI